MDTHCPGQTSPKASKVQQGWKDKQKNREEKGEERAEMQPGASLRGKGESPLPAVTCSPLLCPCPAAQPWLCSHISNA